jgi:hypothetical protein
MRGRPLGHMTIALNIFYTKIICYNINFFDNRKSDAGHTQSRIMD